MGLVNINKHEEEYSMDQDQLWRASLFQAICWVVIFLSKMRLCVETLFIKSEQESEIIAVLH